MLIVHVHTRVHSLMLFWKRSTFNISIDHFQYLLKFILGSEAWGNKTNLRNAFFIYSLLRLEMIFVSFLQASQPSMTFNILHQNWSINCQQLILLAQQYISCQQ